MNTTTLDAAVEKFCAAAKSRHYTMTEVAGIVKGVYGQTINPASVHGVVICKEAINLRQNLKAQIDKFN